MILSVQRAVHDAIAATIQRHFGLADVPAFAVEVPPNRTLGDLAVPVAFQLAQALGSVPGVARVVATPNGYLNLYLERAAFLAARVRQQVAPTTAASGKTI